MLGFKRPSHYVISVLSGFNKYMAMALKQIKMRGSVLVFSLLVLSILLSITLTSVGVVITGKNSSRSTEKSALAFQIADGATENVLKRVYKDTDPTLSALAGNLYHDQDAGQGNPVCSNGVISGSLPSASSGTYSVTFLANDGSVIPCSGAGYATYNEWRTKLVRVMASGSYAGATRAIDVTIKPPVCGNSTTVDDEDGNTYDLLEIGDQCWMQQNMRVGTRIDSSELPVNAGAIEKYCYSDNSSNCDNDNHPNFPDGALYTWDEAMQGASTEEAQGICPDGWHVPSNMDWYTLEHFIDPSVNNAFGPQGTDVGTKLEPGGSSGFEKNYAGVLAAGPQFSGRGLPGQATAFGFYWSSSEFSSTEAQAEVSWGGISGTVNRSERLPKSEAYSVRCVKD